MLRFGGYKKTPFVIIVVVVITLLGVFAIRYNRSSSFEVLNTKLLSINPEALVPIYLRPQTDQIGRDRYVYKLDSFHFSEGVIGFQLENLSRETLQITQQVRPDNFFQEDYPGRIQLNTFTGPAVIGNNQTATSAGLFTDKTLVFLRAEHVIDDDTLREILGSFSKD